MSTHSASIRSYLRSNSYVLSAGRKLQRKLDGDVTKLASAITELEEAATDQDTGASYRAFMFSALGETETTEKKKRQKLSEDILATVVADLQVGSVFVAAGEAVGEAGNDEATKQEGKRRLDVALNSLQETTPAVEQALSTPVSDERPSSVDFSAEGAQPQVVKSPEIDKFRSLSEQTMTTFVSQFREVVVSVLEALKEPLKRVGILEVLDKFSGPLKTSIDVIGRLIRKGIAKIQSALDALVDLIGNDALTKIKETVKDLWNKIGIKKVDEWGNEMLADFIGVQATRTAVEGILGGDLKWEPVEKGINELSQLQQPFRDNMEMAKKAVAVVSLVSAVLFVLPIAGQKVALFAAVSYLVILSAALLIAMDYCDSGRILQRVRGVGEIANSLRT